jgi:tetratricopeptide (TPR) repeat protein
MAESFHIEWDYYMQGFRLHQRMTKAANKQAQRMFLKAIAIAHDHLRRIPRADGLLSFTYITARLNGWMDAPAVAAMLADARRDIKRLKGFKELTRAPLASAVKAIKSLTGKASLTQIANAVIVYYASAAVALDPTDFDNHWSLGTANLYTRDFDGAFESYKTAHDLAKRGGAPGIGRNSLKIDHADALFFRAPYAGEKGPVPDDVRHAIDLAEEAIDSAKKTTPDDPKRFRWNWTLGWAYYEAYDFARSLTALLQIQNPHDLINKNIIASYVGLGRVDLAIPIARDLLQRNPDYTLALEDLWPYQYSGRRDRWKDHLRAAGLPD